MKSAATVLALLVLAAAAVGAQQTVDVVYLRDGTVITGQIVEMEKYPVQRLKIETEDGSVVTVDWADVDRVVERVVRAPAATTEATPAAGGGTAPAPKTADDPAMPKGYLNINLLGFLQFGPTIEYGFKVAEDLYLAPHLRLDGLGLLNWILFPDTARLYTPAIGIGLQHFLDSSAFNANRLYYGGGLEAEGAGDVPFEEPILNVYANLGYRFRSGAHNRFMNVGAHLGVSYDFWWEELMVFGMVELSFGWELPKR